MSGTETSEMRNACGPGKRGMRRRNKRSQVQLLGRQRRHFCGLRFVRSHVSILCGAPCSDFYELYFFSSGAYKLNTSFFFGISFRFDTLDGSFALALLQ